MYDAVVADALGQTIERLAATTDEQQAVDIRDAAADALVAFDRWRSSPAWRSSPVEARLVDVVGSVRTAVTELPADAPLEAVMVAATPLLSPWWPNRPEPAAEVDAAIERLRYLAMTRTRLIADCRILVGMTAWKF